MTGNIIDAITENYHSFTKAGKRLADYIYHHASAAQYLSISALAEESGVSEASITRFCRSLGLSGYNDFKLALAKADRISDLGDPLNSPQTITSGDSLDSIVHKVHASNIVSLNETLALMDEGRLNQAVNLLVSAGRVYCFGHGGSMVMAMEAWARFSTASSKFIHIADSHMQSMAAALATPGDAILFFSYSGSTKDMEDILETARQRQVPVILITHFPKSRATEFASVVLLVGCNETPLQGGSIPAKVCQLFLVECLYYGFCQKLPEQISEARRLTAEAVTKKLL